MATVTLVERRRVAVAAVGLVAVLAGCGSSGRATKRAAIVLPAVPASATELTFVCGNAELCGVLGDGSATAVLPLPVAGDQGGTAISPNGRMAATAGIEGASGPSTTGGVTIRSAAGGPSRTILVPTRVPDDRNSPIPGAGSPVWNPQGTAVAVSEPTLDGSLGLSDCQIWVVPISGRGAHPLDATAKPPLHCQPPSLAGQSLTWNPAGTELAYTTPAGLMVISVSGGSPKLLRAEPNLVLSSLAWSPDGSIILAEFFEGTAGGSVPGGVAAFPADGKAPRILVPPATARVRLGSPGLDWSPDGRRFAFIADDRSSVADTPRIVTAAANGTGLRTLIQPSDPGVFQLTGWTRTNPAVAAGLGPGTTPTTAGPTTSVESPATSPPSIADN